MDNNEVVTEEVAAVVENNTGIEIEPLFEEQVDFDTFSDLDRTMVGKTKYEETDIYDSIEEGKEAIKNWMDIYYKNRWEN